MGEKSASLENEWTFGPDVPTPTRHPCAGLLRDEFLFEVFPTAVLP